MFHAEAIALLGDLLYEATKDLDFQAIGGLEVGAIPMAAAALTAFHRNGRSLEGFFVRKQAKEHGSKERLEGQVKSGDKVVVIDDVLTTGGSVIQAIEAVEALGATVVRVVCICDRLQGAREALAKYDFRPLFTIRDFGIEPAPANGHAIRRGPRKEFPWLCSVSRVADRLLPRHRPQQARSSGRGG